MLSPSAQEALNIANAASKALTARSSPVKVNPLTIHKLLHFRMFNKTQTESTCVANIDYDPEIQDMTVEFMARGTYVYHDVPLDTYTDFELSSSQGKYFNFYIRNSFSYERIA